MPLDGVLRNGAGGTGSRVLHLQPVPYTNHEIVAGSAFGIGVTTAGTAVVGCTVTPGVPHTTIQLPAETQLRLVRLAPDGTEAATEDGPVGMGTWFGPAPGDAFYALARRDAPTPQVVVHRWGGGVGNWPTAGRVLTAAEGAGGVLADQYAAGASPNGSLYLLTRSSLTEFRPDGTASAFKTRDVAFRAIPGVHRLLWSGGRFLVLSSSTRFRLWSRGQVRAFQLTRAGLQADQAWGKGGVWDAPQGFEPLELISHAAGGFRCIGWQEAGVTRRLTEIQISEDGQATLGTYGGLPIEDQGRPVHLAAASDGGLLGAVTGPSLLSFFIPGLAPWAYVLRSDPVGQGDMGFGNQGVCFAPDPLGYPLWVRGLAATATGFFLACDRDADIRGPAPLPMVLAFTAAGQPAPDFGDRGVVHHEEIPGEVVIHGASDLYAVGTKWVEHPPQADEIELAVTRLVPRGALRFLYGTGHGHRSAPLDIGGQRSEYFTVSTAVAWNGLLAIGVDAARPVAGSFVVFRDSNGNPHPPGAGTAVPIGGRALALVGLPDGSLEVTFQSGSPVTIQRTRILPGLTLDPAPPVTVPTPPAGLLLTDGSRVNLQMGLSNLGPSYLLQAWLVRTLPGGTVDPQFGGGGTALPTDPARIFSRSGFTSQDRLEVAGGVLALPGGGFTLMIVGRRQSPLQPFDLGTIATGWGADGRPLPAWGDGVLLSDLMVVHGIRTDHPARIVVIGAIESGAPGSRTPALVALRPADGTLDPGFGVQGRLVVPFRGSEDRVAMATIRCADGTELLPVRTVVRDVTQIAYQRALTWIEVT